MAILLGIVQGLTEFLPVSSSGHLILFERLLGVSGDNLLFNIVVHVGTLCAVVVYYRKKLWEMAKKPFSKEVILLALSCLPTVIIYFLFKDFFNDSFKGAYLGISFLITAALLGFGQWAINRKSSNSVNVKTALVMGAFQGFAIIPGVSRSGSTLAAGLAMGADKQKVADFSFLMSLPIILGSLFLELIGGGFVGVNIWVLLAGFLSSFASGYIAIRFML